MAKNESLTYLRANLLILTTDDVAKLISAQTASSKTIDHQNSSAEVSKVHWKHYKRLLVLKASHNSNIDEDCVEEPPRAVDEFPTDFLTKEQRLKGLFLFHIFFAIYFFTFMAIICDKYFIPAVERICLILNISQVRYANLQFIQFMRPN